ncbi:response regulator [Treponema sp. Marseille-Q4132]|uniref:response regulator transcription factor n=1 Tax=Treponema sp. Marseille-Q4132 TaxID=2766701 RepID=UPI001652DFB5|nr:response regulator [Treponema sp. Marseille-Q4132]QNL96403.1 response regulator [Treponema sp. Marseille-Q4132]
MMIPVVIAEDEKQIRDGIVKIIPWHDLGFEVKGAVSNGTEALDLLRTIGDESLLITDIRMPKMDGISLLKAVRKEELPVKVLIISGYDDFAYAREVIKYGGADYLIKPVSEEELEKALGDIKKAFESENEKKLLPSLRLPQDKTTVMDDTFMHTIESYVYKNYQHAISIADVSNLVNLSENYFSHLFKQLSGETFTHYLNKVRISKSCRLLEKGNLKIYEIAEQVGFTNYKYFNSIFKKITGQSPTKYKSAIREI